MPSPLRPKVQGLEGSGDDGDPNHTECDPEQRHERLHLQKGSPAEEKERAGQVNLRRNDTGCRSIDAKSGGQKEKTWLIWDAPQVLPFRNATPQDQPAEVVAVGKRR